MLKWEERLAVRGKEMVRMNISNGYVLKTIFFLFAVNSISLYLYFSSHPDHKQPPQPGNRHSPPGSGPHLWSKHHRKSGIPDLPGLPRAKPWPILPSYLPWSQNPDAPFRSCESYFGNGFTRRADILHHSNQSVTSAGGGGSSWFRCLFSETLQSSICEGGRLRMVPEKIKMSLGGESLEAVIGRGEDDELPAFEAGAFSIQGGGEGLRTGKKLVSNEFLDGFVPRNMVSRHTMRDLIDSIGVVGEDQFQCSEWIEEPVLLVTRFEYANLFHTVTDWYSAYVASRVTGLPSRPHVIFVDGHCKAPLEETWKALFSSIRYAKSFSGSVCFRHAILSPLGYETALFKGLTEDIQCRGAPANDLWQHPDSQKTARLSEFGEMVRAAFGFPVHRQNARKPGSGHNVLFVRREDYLAHPRHSGVVQSRLNNELEVFESLKGWAAKHSGCKVNVVNGLFAHTSMKEQVRAIQDASVIVGAHGAGLTHVISASPKAMVLEIISSQYRRPHFELIARWKGLDYHAINLAGSYANPGMVVGKVRDILGMLGC